MQQKTPGSKRYEKARVQLAKLHEHIANQRLDALHKLSTDLIRRYDVICLPEVPVAKAIQSVAGSVEEGVRQAQEIFEKGIAAI